MAAAGLFLHKSGKSRAKPSTQGWSPNSGQAAEDESGSFVDVLVSEQGQQSSSSGLTLPQQQNQQAGTQTQSASSLDQPQNGLVRYQPTGSNPEPPTANALGQYQPAGNNETPLARDDLNSDVIVNAQLARLVGRDDASQGQDAPHVSDVPMPDAPTVHDIATKTHHWRTMPQVVHQCAQPPTGKRKCAACCMCGIHFCGDLAHWRSRIVSALGFSSCQSVHLSGWWIHTAALNMTTLRWALDRVTKPLTFLCSPYLRTTNLLGPDSILRSEHAQQRRSERRHNKPERMKR